MRKSRALSVVAGAALVGLALAGCSTTAGGGKTASGVVTVARLSGTDSTFNQLAAEFHKENPSLTVKYTILPVDTYNQQIGTRLSAGTAPDVLNVFPGSGNATAVDTLAKNGYLEDLSKQSWVSKQPSSTSEVTSYKGKRYMFTDVATANTIGGIYNVDALKAAGLSIPTTFSGVLKFCAAAKSQGKVAYALGAQTQWVTQLVTYALVASDEYASDPSFNQQQLAGKATFQKSGWLTALNQYKEMFTDGCFNSDALGTSVDTQTSMVANGQALASIQISTLGNGIAAAKPGVSLKLAPLPATDNTSKTRLAFGLGVGWGVNAKAKNLAGAEKFVEFLTTPEASKLTADKYGMAPNGKVEANSINALEVPYVLKGLTMPFPDVYWPSAQVQNQHFIGVQELLGGQETAEQVLTNMQNAFTQALK